MVNAAKHSGAIRIHLYSEINDGTARVNVRDRGRGLVGGTGGLVDGTGDQALLADSLLERVAAVRGSVTIESAAGRGTDVTITVPSP
jgi:signal transduction histidine kinase